MTVVVVQSVEAVVVRLMPSTTLSAAWETPSPPAHVPKYLLLSVLLV